MAEIPNWLLDALEDSRSISSVSLNSSPNLSKTPKTPEIPSSPLLQPLEKSLGNFVKLSTHYKKSEINNLIYVQEIHGFPVTASCVSSCGNYLITGGKDGIIRLYPLECLSNELGYGETKGYLYPFSPRLEWKGHTDSITCLKMHPHLFLLSSSLDKTVRLWHTKSSDCLGIYQHPDIVTCISWCPLSSSYGWFCTTCLDGKLRWYGMVEKSCLANISVPVNASLQVNDVRQSFPVLTSCEFTLDGKMIVVGGIDSTLTFYEFPSFQFLTQINLELGKKSGEIKTEFQGYNVKISWMGEKVLGINFSQPSTTLRNLSGSISLDYAIKSLVKETLVVTTMDRIRILQTNDKSTLAKFKGIKPSCPAQYFSNFIVVGSTDGKVCFFSMEEENRTLRSKLTTSESISSYEYFVASDVAIVNVLIPNCRHTLEARGWRTQSKKPLVGMILVIVDISGRIKVYEIV